MIGAMLDQTLRTAQPPRPALGTPDRHACGSRAARLEQEGFEVIPYVLTESECRVTCAQVGSCGIARAGARNLLPYPWCRELAQRLLRHFGIARRLPPEALAVQCTLFDKSVQRNWHVTPHQDLSVPVREWVDSDACRGWSHKDGMVFVQPPIDVLEGLLAARLHLDDCAAANGALRVVPGSHRHGRLNAKGIEALRTSHGELVCTVPRGGVMLMRPLLLHASSRTLGSGPRRVLHFVFGGAALPAGLSWAVDGA